MVFQAQGWRNSIEQCLTQHVIIWQEHVLSATVQGRKSNGKIEIERIVVEYEERHKLVYLKKLSLQRRRKEPSFCI